MAGVIHGDRFSGDIVITGGGVVFSWYIYDPMVFDLITLKSTQFIGYVRLILS